MSKGPQSPFMLFPQPALVPVRVSAYQRPSISTEASLLGGYLLARTSRRRSANAKRVRKRGATHKNEPGPTGGLTAEEQLAMMNPFKRVMITWGRWGVGAISTPVTLLSLDFLVNVGKAFTKNPENIGEVAKIASQAFNHDVSTVLKFLAKNVFSHLSGTVSFILVGTVAIVLFWIRKGLDAEHDKIWPPPPAI